jgi:hypothetical protein
MDKLTSDQVFQLALVAIGGIVTIIGSLAGASAGAAFQARRARPKLSVRARWGFVLGPTQGEIISVISANVGPLPMRVEQCGVLLSIGDHRIALMQDDIGLAALPRDLGPGQSVTMHIYVARLKATLQEHANDQRRSISLKGAYAQDATGKEWTGPMVNMQDIRADPHR